MKRLPDLRSQRQLDREARARRLRDLPAAVCCVAIVAAWVLIVKGSM